MNTNQRDLKYFFYIAMAVGVIFGSMIATSLIGLTLK